ncbi:MAG: hypothetical protein IT211_00265 [Armatimonadetes bacterium]|nr:hypothetical protein [Armatimonadota bacterium]
MSTTIRRYATLCVMLLAWAQLSTAQNRETNIWMFGRNAGLDFNIPPATPTAPVEITTSSLNTSEGSAVICDRTTGQLLFYTNGIQVFNRNNAAMPGGTLGGQPSSTQPALAIPDLSNPNRYYVFTTPQEAEPTRTIEVSVVNMTLQGGLGDLEPGQIRQPLPAIPGRPAGDTLCEKLTATQDAAGTGYWVLFHQFGTNAFYAYHLTAVGIIGGVTSNVGTPIRQSGIYNQDRFDTRGEMKFSPDGQWIATANEDFVSELFSFNKTTGAVTFVARLDSNQQHYGVSFSPNSRRLYINTGWTSGGTSIFQYDLDNPAPAAILASRTLVGTSVNSLGAMQIGPDGRIYVVRVSQRQIGAITCPDELGTACNYVDDGFLLTGPRSNVFGLPNIVLEAVAEPDYASPDRRVCRGATLQIGSPARPGYTYQWAPAAGLDRTDISAPTFSGTATTQYIVSVTSPFSSCTVRRDTVVVTVVPPPDITMPRDTAICAGDQFQLNPSSVAGTQFSWSPATGLSNPNIRNPIANPTATTAYTLTVRNADNCADSATVTITVNPIPTLAGGPDTSVCADGTVQLGVAPVAGVAYRWSPATGLSDTAVAQPFFTSATPGNAIYTVTATNAQGCSISDQVTVRVDARPVAGAGQDDTICTGEATRIGTSQSAGLTYQWTPTTGLSDPLAADPIATPRTTTTYQVIASNNLGCADTSTVRIVVIPRPPATIISADDTICAGASTQLQVAAGARYRWTPSSGLSSDTIANPLASPLATTTYQVVATNSFGCSDTAEVTIAVVRPVLALALPDTIANPHQRDFRIPVLIDAAGGFAECLPDTIRLSISVNANCFRATGFIAPTGATAVLDPGPAPGIGPKRRTLTIILTGTTALQGGDTLGQLVGDVLLGDSITTALDIEGATFAGLTPTLTTRNGSLTIDPLCLVGGVRMLANAGGFGIAKITPNPTHGGAVVDVLTAERGGTTLAVFDAAGTQVYAVRWDAISAVERPGGDFRSFTLPATLAAGIYRVVLATPSRQATESLIILK